MGTTKTQALLMSRELGFVQIWAFLAPRELGLSTLATGTTRSPCKPKKSLHVCAMPNESQPREVVAGPCRCPGNNSDAWPPLSRSNFGEYGKNPAGAAGTVRSEESRTGVSDRRKDFFWGLRMAPKKDWCPFGPCTRGCIPDSGQK